jgi:hypothetical protein
MATIVDSYAESNQDDQDGMWSGGKTYIGQSFTCSTAATLDSAKFFLKKAGSPTGSIYAVLYAETHATAYGTDSVPTGAALATSDAVDVSSLTTSFQLITFNFSGANRVALTAPTYYCIECNYSGGASGTDPIVGEDSSSPTHSGNWHYYTTSWLSNGAVDTIFYVYGVVSGTTANPHLLNLMGAGL